MVLPLVSFLGLHLSTGTLFPYSLGTNSLLPPSKILRDMRVNILSFSISKKILKLLLINKIRMNYILLLLVFPLFQPTLGNQKAA